MAWILFGAVALVPIAFDMRPEGWTAWAIFFLYFLWLALHAQTYHIEVTDLGIAKTVLGRRREILWSRARPARSRPSIGSLWAPTLGGRTIIVEDETQRVSFTVPRRTGGRVGVTGSGFGGTLPTGLQEVRWLVDEIGRRAGFDEKLQAIVDRDRRE